MYHKETAKYIKEKDKNSEAILVKRKLLDHYLIKGKRGRKADITMGQVIDQLMNMLKAFRHLSSGNGHLVETLVRTKETYPGNSVITMVE
jgi:hypothetical protein